MTDKPQVLVLKFDETMVQIAAFAIVYLARTDTAQNYKIDSSLSLQEQLITLFTQDDQGRRLLKSVGPGYFGSAIGLTLLSLFSLVPEGMRPTGEDGEPICVRGMAESCLEAALNFIRKSSITESLPEGPKREST